MDIVIDESKLLEVLFARTMNDTISLPCEMVLRLMDTEEYRGNYCRALDIVLKLFPKINWKELVKELDKRI